MYHVECYMKTLKGYVKNKEKRIGKMTKGYAIENAL
jgi:hypothetical protein